ncbi:hypothetical protein DV735_g1656, partial [Chaetothyriales sp. CBS 134920]
MAPNRVSLSNTLEQTLQDSSGRTFLVQVSWPLQWTEKDTERECPVLYVVDGNAMFLTATEAAWRRATGARFSGGGIVVAVGYVLEGRVYDRSRGYDLTPPTPGVEDDDDPDHTKFGGADGFLSFIIDSVKPLVAQLFPKVTFTRQGLYGHSFGGLFTLHALFTRPDAFDGFIAASPSAWWRNEWIFKEAEQYASSAAPPSTQKKPSVILSCGSLEQWPKRWRDESPEDFEKRERGSAERRMVDNAGRLKEILLNSGKLDGVLLQEYPDYFLSLIMLDTFEIITTSGVVLWSRTTSAIGTTAVNSLINDVFIEEKARPAESNPTYKYDKYTLRYTLVKDFGLIFVAVYQSLLGLSWVDKLLDHVRTIFVTVYKDQLSSPSATAVDYPFDSYFDKELARLGQAPGVAAVDQSRGIEVQEKKSDMGEVDTGGPPPPEERQPRRAQPKAVLSNGDDSSKSTPLHSPDTSRPVTPLSGAASHLVTDKIHRGSRRARKAASAATSAPTSDTDSKRDRKASGKKKGRVWGPDGVAGEDDGAQLDYSAPATDEVHGNGLPKSPAPEAIDAATVGTKNKKGQFVLRDLDDDELDSLLQSADKDKAAANGTGAASSSPFAAISGYFRNIVGGKTLTNDDLDKPLKAMEEHLMSKNVARDAAVRLCDGVRTEMVGKTTGAFESTDAALRPALEKTLRKILTPRGSLDLLQSIDSITRPASSNVKARPFVITILGVNGVGKSTNLSKLCYFLLQNNYRVLIAAGDTFRSGAVEQLGVHVRNLKELTERESLGAVDIYQKGYGKDAANVAKDAVAFAAEHDYQVVLIDTAGRAHTNTQLMAALEKLVDFAKPDLILQVAEALVGNDSVGQARNFTKALGKNRKLDGFIVSKIDTVGDACGTIVSMVHATGVPVQFIGVGQHYGDLRQLSVPWAVKMLMA